LPWSVGPFFVETDGVDPTTTNRLTVGKHTLHASVTNGDIFAFLPSLDELRAAAGQE
jgi:hypothetical protein